MAPRDRMSSALRSVSSSIASVTAICASIKPPSTPNSAARMAARCPTVPASTPTPKSFAVALRAACPPATAALPPGTRAAAVRHAERALRSCRPTRTVFAAIEGTMALAAPPATARPPPVRAVAATNEPHLAVPASIGFSSSNFSRAARSSGSMNSR